MVINIKESKRDFLRYIDLKNVNNILDIGCSNGYLSKYFCDNGIHSTGVDIKKVDIDLENFDFVNKDIRKFDFNEKYDVIISSLILHFLENDDVITLIKNMKEHTEIGGYNLLILMSSQNPISNPNYFYPCIDELRMLYSDWEVIKCLADFTEFETHGDNASHNHHLIFFLVKNGKF